MIDFINTLLKKDELISQVPDDFKPFITAFVKNLAISNFKREDVPYILNSFDDAKIATLMAVPPGAYTWDAEYFYTLLRPLIYTEACRSVDGFERKMEATSITQSYLQQDIPMQQQSGLFGKVKRIFGR